MGCGQDAVAKILGGIRKQLCVGLVLKAEEVLGGDGHAGIDVQEIGEALAGVSILSDM